MGYSTNINGVNFTNTMAIKEIVCSGYGYLRLGNIYKRYEIKIYLQNMVTFIVIYSMISHLCVETGYEVGWICFTFPT